MKKQWISVKCGLSRDPKHRRKMGKTIWTFLHMLDLADWETGIVYDWKDEHAAEDMGIDIRVLREDRRQLEKEDYISCKQKQYGQDITIHNWTNPREYTGEIYNKKQGYKKLPPSKDAQGDAQGDTQGDTQGSIKDVTPTLDSKNQISKGDIFGFMAMSEDLKNKQNMDEIEQIAVSLETGLRFNFPRGTKDQAVYRRILKSGKPVERFIEWVKSDEKRLSYAFLYAKDTETIWRDWPQVDNVSMNPQGLEIGL